jgi:hypothetical protein
MIPLFVKRPASPERRRSSSEREKLAPGRTVR